MELWGPLRGPLRGIPRWVFLLHHGIGKATSQELLITLELARDHHVGRPFVIGPKESDLASFLFLLDTVP